jgi:hypothetical protein
LGNAGRFFWLFCRPWIVVHCLSLWRLLLQPAKLRAHRFNPQETTTRRQRCADVMTVLATRTSKKMVCRSDYQTDRSQAR